MALEIGTKVYVAPDDLTDDDGFRDVGTIVGIIYQVQSEEDGEVFAVYASAVSPVHR